jgi:glucose/arabinose dehydrogenase
VKYGKPEFGPRGGDEVNLVRAGKDYGWPTITYGIEYSGQKVGDAIQQSPAWNSRFIIGTR